MKILNLVRGYLLTTVLVSNSYLTVAQQIPNYLNEKLSQHERVLELLHQLSLEEKASLLIASSPGIPRLAIDKYYHGNEALHGVVRPGKFTVFPQAIALASMWNQDLQYRVATAISDEARARWNELEQGKKQTLRFNDLLTFWSPTMNMARDPRWGRTPETYGEDPYLTGVLATQFVKGLQGNHPRYLKVVATPKHFAANNEETNRFSCNAVIPMRMLREYYLPAYEMAIKDGKAASIMAAYNAINGVPCGANPWLLNQVLRKEWGFQGYVVSDCGGPSNLVTAHQYVKTKEMAATVSLKAGLDLECGDNIYKQPLLNAYQQGLVSMAEIDTAAYRVLRARMQLGLFDNPDKNPYNQISPAIVGSAKHQALALEAARQGIVLLKNEQSILPLNATKIKSVAVVGINANNAEFGDYSGESVVSPITILQGIQQKLGNQVKVNFAEWKPINGLEGYVLIGKEFFPNGLTAEYFSNMTLEGIGKKRLDNQINIEPENQAPDAFLPTGSLSIKWVGKIKPSISGKYSLGFLSHDGCRLTINGQLIIDSWKRKATVTEFADIFLEAGKEYDFQAEYFVKKDAVAKLYWKTPEVDFKITELFKEAIAAAKESEYTIAVLGMNKNFEREGQDRNQIGLSKDQELFIREIRNANPRTIVVFVAGSSLAIDWIDQHIPAILDAWYPGEQGGKAVADVLFGDYNPAGRLPLTFYKTMEDLLPFNDYDVSKGRTYQYFKGKVLYPFGYGLSYTQFQYTALNVSNHRDSLGIRFQIKNYGNRDGEEVAQVYVKMPNSTIPMPLKQLKGFQRIFLNKGQTKHVLIKIDKAQLRYWDDSTEKFVQPKGLYQLLIGASSQDIRLQQTITIN